MIVKTSAEFNDYPFDEVVDQAVVLILRGGTVHQKWTCCHCGSRQTMEEPNKFFRQGICEECRGTTDIRECNYLYIMSSPDGGQP